MEATGHTCMPTCKGMHVRTNSRVPVRSSGGGRVPVRSRGGSRGHKAGLRSLGEDVLACCMCVLYTSYRKFKLRFVSNQASPALLAKQRPWAAGWTHRMQPSNCEQAIPGFPPQGTTSHKSNNKRGGGTCLHTTVVSGRSPVTGQAPQILVDPAHTRQACNDLGQNVRAGSPEAAGTTIEWPSGSRGE